MERGVYFSPHIAIHQIAGDLELLSKDIQLSIAPDETNKHNAPLGYMVKPWQLGSRRKHLRNIFESSDGLYRGSALQATVTMVFIVKPLEILALSLER